MSDGNFSDFIAKERDRLNAEREQLFNQQHEIEQKLDAVNKEFAAITAYETAKSGKPARASASASNGTVRTRRGSKRDGILEALQGIGDGLSRGDLLAKLGLKGDKAGEMSVSNALTALTKAGAVIRNDAKKYILG